MSAGARATGGASDRNERPKICTVETPTARTEHTCCECHRTIQPGETYEKTRGLWDDWRTFKTCSWCVEWRDELLDEWSFELVLDGIINDFRHYPGDTGQWPADGQWEYHNGYEGAA